MHLTHGNQAKSFLPRFPFFSFRLYNNNNNNIAFQSQVSWGRLELKPIESPKSRFRHFNSCFSSFQISFYCLPHINFGLPLPLLILLAWPKWSDPSSNLAQAGATCTGARLRTPQCTGAFKGLLWTWPNHLNRCWTNFSSIGATPNLSRVSSFRTRSLLVWPQIQHNIRISTTLIYWTCHLFVDQHSAPYYIEGLIVVL